MSKKDMFKVVLLIPLSVFLVYLVINASNSMGLSAAIVWGVWTAIFVIIFLLFRLKRGVNLMNTIYSITLSLVILLIIPFVFAFIYSMNPSQK